MAARVTARLENSKNRYGTVAIALHWLMAVLLAALLALGVYMARLPDVGYDSFKIGLILYHKQLGMLALTLAALRLAWRVRNALPELAHDLPEWQKVIARFVHLSFYGLMVALPVSGWLMSSAAGFPLSFLGLLPVPDLVRQDDDLFRTLVAIHRGLGYLLILLILLHAGAALRHHLFLKDDTLRKMLPDSVSAPTATPFADGL
jgi:cytochrome b561